MSGNPTFGLPATNIATDAQTGAWTSTWYQFLVRLAQLSAERPIAAVSPGASPYSYTASTIGHMLVTGGSVSSITLKRGTTTVTCTGSPFIPMAANDVVTVTYSVAPTMNFIPSARA